MSMLARRAFLMRQRGMAIFDIAEELGLTESTTGNLLRNAVQNAARLVSEGARSDLLAMEVTRLDAMQAAAWGAAMQGDTRAIDAILKVIAARAKLLGLEVPAVESVAQMVVVSNDDGEYLRALKQIVSQRGITDGDA